MQYAIVDVKAVTMYQPSSDQVAAWCAAYGADGVAEGFASVRVMPAKARAIKLVRAVPEPRRNPFPKPGKLEGRMNGGRQGYRQANWEGLTQRLVADRSGWNRLAVPSERDRDAQQTWVSVEARRYARWSEVEAEDRQRCRVRKGHFTSDHSDWQSFDRRYGEREDAFRYHRPLGVLEASTYIEAHCKPIASNVIQSELEPPLDYQCQTKLSDRMTTNQRTTNGSARLHWQSEPWPVKTKDQIRAEREAKLKAYLDVIQ